MRSRSADRPEARRGPGACGGAAPSLAADDGGEGGHRGVSVGHRGGRRPAWPSRRQPWWRQWRSPTPHRRQGRSAGRPDSPQRHRVRRGGRQDRSPPPAPPEGAGSHQRPTEPPAGLDRDACCRSSCHSQGGHAADFPRLSSGAQGRVKKASAAVPAARWRCFPIGGGGDEYDGPYRIPAVRAPGSVDHAPFVPAEQARNRHRLHRCRRCGVHRKPLAGGSRGGRARAFARSHPVAGRTL